MIVLVNPAYDILEIRKKDSDLDIYWTKILLFKWSKADPELWESYSDYLN